MTGAVTVCVAELTPFRRRARIGITVDGVRLGRVTQGQTQQLLLAPGAHTLRVAGLWGRSNVVDIDVQEGTEHRFTAVSTGAWTFFLATATFMFGFFLFVPDVGTAYLAVVATMGLLALAPGTVFRVRAAVAPTDGDQPREASFWPRRRRPSSQ